MKSIVVDQLMFVCASSLYFVLFIIIPCFFCINNQGNSSRLPKINIIKCKANTASRYLFLL